MERWGRALINEVLKKKWVNHQTYKLMYKLVTFKSYQKKKNYAQDQSSINHQGVWRVAGGNVLFFKKQ